MSRGSNDGEVILGALRSYMRRHGPIAVTRKVRSYRMPKTVRGNLVQLAGFTCVVEGGFQINRTVGSFVAGAVLVFLGHAIG